jgi:MFS family permease
MGVGIGEAVLSPAAYSLIADYIRPERRGRAISVFYLSYAIGQGAAFSIGALLLRSIPDTGIDLPLIGVHAPWRIAFLLAGMPGLLLAFVLLTVREPARREVTLGASAGNTIADDSAVRHVRAHAMAYMPLFAIPSAMAIVGYTAMNWAPAFFARRFDLPPTSAGPILGGMMMAAGLFGTLIAGALGDRLVRRRVAGARLPLALAASAMLVPTSLWPLAPQLWLSMTMLGIMMFGLMLGLACMPAIAQDITPNRMRGQVVAAYAFVAGIIGIAIAPTLVALLTDHVFRDEALVGYSLAVVAFPAALFGAIACWAGLKPYARTYDAFHGGRA